MTGKFHPVPLELLLRIILRELRDKGSVFGMPKELFFKPGLYPSLRSSVFGKIIDTPFGVAAGPHTQMAQNIVAAWLCGARYIELKTIQDLDNIEVAKPCIEMRDEGWNREWSQELSVKESFDEYLKAWILIHILCREAGIGNRPGMIFNMSAGYSLDGILGEKVQWFINSMRFCRDALDRKKEEIRKLIPEIDSYDIPETISDNITLSTMHGCPPEEISSIASWLTGSGLNTMIKLNPTLPGRERVRNIVNTKLNFRTIIPDKAFDHDLSYDDAVPLIRRFLEEASGCGVIAGLKLTNTLESIDNQNIFGQGREAIYMSGRALHPLAVSLARELRKQFGTDIPISFSAGADAFNSPELIACGFNTVTSCSDLLRPGGVMRLKQYCSELDESIRKEGANNIQSFILHKSGLNDHSSAIFQNLERYSAEVMQSERYIRTWIHRPDIKGQRGLGFFDCIHAPCTDACAARQNIPGYLLAAKEGNTDKAFRTILETNPMPSITGTICDHLCQDKCTRLNYDEPLQIRAIKKSMEKAAGKYPIDRLLSRSSSDIADDKTKKVAIIGAGPAGLSCAWYLACAGIVSEIFESAPEPGGTVRYAIPGFRLGQDDIDADIERIKAAGIRIHFNSPVDREKYTELKKNFDFLFVASGAMKSHIPEIPGLHLNGVTGALEFLRSYRRGDKTETGSNIIVIGGGNSAMDAARCARRISGDNGRVVIVYRRSIAEMPADRGEIAGVLSDGIQIMELCIPEEITGFEGKVTGVKLSHTSLSEPGADGRRSFVKEEGSGFIYNCDTVIIATGQVPELVFCNEDILREADGQIKTVNERVFIGGDALRGAATVVKAVADGRDAAEKIMKKIDCKSKSESESESESGGKTGNIIKRSKRIFSEGVVSSAEEAKREAERCLNCDEFCGICSTVCPNMAYFTYEIKPLNYNLQKALLSSEGDTLITLDRIFSINQSYQVLNIADFCNGCGNCTAFCPTSGVPYRDKPRLCLTEESFRREEEGFYAGRVNGNIRLLHKHDGVIESITHHGDEYIFENDVAIAALSPGDFTINNISFKGEKPATVSFEHAAAMSVILEGALQLNVL